MEILHANSCCHYYSFRASAIINGAREKQTDSGKRMKNAVHKRILTVISKNRLLFWKSFARKISLTTDMNVYPQCASVPQQVMVDHPKYQFPASDKCMRGFGNC